MDWPAQAQPVADQVQRVAVGKWAGDVEPIGFPFLFGIEGTIPAQAYDFDGSEQYLLTACRAGLLYLWEVGGQLREILPHDFRIAAAVLSQGGLHHDAAILYLKVVQDHVAAAHEFELAGDLDRALRLYRQNAEHVRAGDLLRRMGEEELALAEYKLAADHLVRSGLGYLQAGELMLSKAQRPDLASPYFLAGWHARPAGSAIACARQLTKLYAQQGDKKFLLNLATEAEDFRINFRPCVRFHYPGRRRHWPCRRFTASRSLAVASRLLDWARAAACVGWS